MSKLTIPTVEAIAESEPGIPYYKHHQCEITEKGDAKTHLDKRRSEQLGLPFRRRRAELVVQDDSVPLVVGVLELSGE